MKYFQSAKRVLEQSILKSADKVTLKKIREMTFVNAKEILGIIYSSKSGNTQLKWRQTRRRIGKVQGFASPNALVNLVESGVLTQEWVDNYLKLIQNQEQKAARPRSIVCCNCKRKDSMIVKPSRHVKHCFFYNPGRFRLPLYLAPSHREG